jgi:hypothetical protein
MIHFTTQRIKSQRAKKKEEKNIAKKISKKLLTRRKVCGIILCVKKKKSSLLSPTHNGDVRFDMIYLLPLRGFYVRRIVLGAFFIFLTGRDRQSSSKKMQKNTTSTMRSLKKRAFPQRPMYV